MAGTEYKPVLHMEAVRAMLHDEYMMGLLYSNNPRMYLEELYGIGGFPPDWVEAARNCPINIDCRIMAVHTFLMDWRPE